VAGMASSSCSRLPTRSMVRMMQRADLIITDSGGVQEEAPSLGTPVLVAREVTERPEGVALGLACIVGSCPELMVAAARRRWQAPIAASAPIPMATAPPPARIVAGPCSGEPFTAFGAGAFTKEGPPLQLAG
jgi:UDP-N-acetylglucosamine 2-epimerase (non-hydrolysing)